MADIITPMKDIEGKRASGSYETLLFITAAIWGTGFVAQRLGMQDLGPFSYNAARFFVGALALVPVLLFRNISLAQIKAAVPSGLVAGIVLAIAAGFQQFGLLYTTAGKAGFITGLYVVLVPIAAMLLGRKTPILTWIGAASAIAGLYILSFSSVTGLNHGDFLVLVSALFWTVHILVLDRWASKVDPLTLAFIQFFICSILCWIGASTTETLLIANFISGALPILYGGVFSIGIAYSLQAVAQSKAHPAKAAIIMSLESVFAAIAGYFFLNERLGMLELAGCALMLVGMFIAQWPARTVALAKCRTEEVLSVNDKRDPPFT